MIYKTFNILLVEDNAGDVGLIKEVFKECKMRHNLHVIMDGAEAIDFLKQQNGYSDAVRPDLILLDLNLPKKHGFDILREMEKEPDLKRIPVIVLTTSESPDDIRKSYDLNANSYINKPLDIERFMEIVKLIEEYWLKIIKLPQ
ncbi:response regulator [Elusimicrobiota bacterium]